MLARVHTFTIDGVDARPVCVEVDVRLGLPAFTLVGLGDKAVREARDHVRAAIQNSGFEFPGRRITANLAPAYLHKAGPGFDLPLAIGVLAAAGAIPPERAAAAGIHGELALDGEVRPARGALLVAEGTRDAGLPRLVLASSRATEAALVPGLEIVPVTTLREAVEVLRGEREPADVPVQTGDPAPLEAELDLADVRGQPQATRAVQVAAAGGHNLLLEGPPGTGKTMLARRLPGVLPPLGDDEALEVTRIQSAAGQHSATGLIRTPPFRAPHHAISPSGLVGGGGAPKPGEASLAHRGVLFLDELAEFPRPSLEALRQPLEDGFVTIVRGQRSLRFPTEVTLVAATNPCPCGMAGTDRPCRCTDPEIARYRRKLSGPLLDRIDVVVPVRRPPGDALAGEPGAATAAVRATVLAARERQRARGGRPNARLDDHSLQRAARPTEGAVRLLGTAYARGHLSARGRQRVLRVARTLADLADRPQVHEEDIAEALFFRQTATDLAVAA